MKLVALAFAGLILAAADSTPKVTICHATSSTKNPYVIITIDQDGLNGHIPNHPGDKYTIAGQCKSDVGGSCLGDADCVSGAQCDNTVYYDGYQPSYTCYGCKTADDCGGQQCSIEDGNVYGQCVSR